MHPRPTGPRAKNRRIDTPPKQRTLMGNYSCSPRPQRQPEAARRPDDPRTRLLGPPGAGPAGIGMIWILLTLWAPAFDILPSRGAKIFYRIFAPTAWPGRSCWRTSNATAFVDNGDT